MKTLATNIRKNGYDYKLIQRTSRAAIYSQSEQGKIIAYEVGMVKSSKGGEIQGNVIEAGESFWGNEDFGRIAWTKNTLEQAIEKYNEINARPAKQ